MKKIILFFFLWAAWALHAQQVSNMQTRFTGSNVEVTCTLTTNTPEDIELQYSTDNGKTYQACRTVTGDLQSQTSGTKKIIWECAEDGIFKADVILKIGFKSTSGIEMIFVEGGAFIMGCTQEQGRDCESDEKPAHQVTVGDFYIGKYQVTQAQWKIVMGGNPSKFRGDNLPVVNVSWNDVQEFIRKLNTQTGKQYRLPTEAEWEFAARGGDKSKGYKYSGGNTVDKVAWYNGNCEQPNAVGAKSPNELGIYDMNGNVWEWCQDWYSENYYKSSPSTNPKGPESGENYVLRGGSWDCNAKNCRVTHRDYGAPGHRDFYCGFRLACSTK